MCLSSQVFPTQCLKELLQLSEVSKWSSILKHRFLLKIDYLGRFKTFFFFFSFFLFLQISLFQWNAIFIAHLLTGLYLYQWTTHVPQIVLPFLLSGPSAVLWAATILGLFPLSTSFRLNKAFVKAQIIARPCSAVLMCFCGGFGVF